MENGRDGKEGGTSLKCLWGGRGGTLPHGMINWNLHADFARGIVVFENLLLVKLFFFYLLYIRESSKYVHL